MNEYHKINSIYRRTERGEMILGDFSCPEFEFLAANRWVATEKIDGTNVRVMWTDSGIRFGGKTDAAQMPVFLFDRLGEIFAGAEDAFDPGACLYGEGFGARIQKGGGNYISDGVDFVLFDVKVDDVWLERENVEDIAAKLGLQIAPIVLMGTLYDAEGIASEGFCSQWGAFAAEGLVMRPEVELQDRRGGRVITKIKTTDFARAIRDTQ